MALSARQIAFQALMSIETDKSYSNIVLSHILSDFDVAPRDKAFVSMLFYGVIEKKLLLDYNLALSSERPVNQLDIPVLVILRMGLYQLFFMDSVPPSAAVNESVKLCKDNKLYNASGYVNGVLRACAKQEKLSLPDKKRGKNKYFSVKYSCPETVIKLWRNAYGDEVTEGILSCLDGRPPMSARVNTLKTRADKLITLLSNEGVKAEKSSVAQDCILMNDTGAVEELQCYRRGLFHVQDTSSQLCCRLLQAQSGHTVIDACSAPGGKSFTIAEFMENQGKIISCDLYDHRLKMVRSGAERLGINIIETLEGDMSQAEILPMADRVLCDVPCSGLGIIRRKPELRYKNNLGLDTLPDLQYFILCNVSRFVKSGGLLVYSTCTLNPQENGENIRRFLREHSDFIPEKINLPDCVKRTIEEPDNELTLFPQTNGTDGFFISLIRKK